MENIYLNFMKNGIDLHTTEGPLNLFKYKYQHDKTVLMHHLKDTELSSTRMVNTRDGMRQIYTIGGIVIDDETDNSLNIVNYNYFAWKMNGNQDKNMYYIYEEYNTVTGTSNITSTLVGYAEELKPGYVPNHTRATAGSALTTNKQ